MSLAGKVAIVTGGGTGIGFGISQVLALKGAKIVIAQPDLEVARLAVERLPNTNAFPFEIDIRNPSAAEQMVEYAVRCFDRLDILINNAGITGTEAIAPILQCTPVDVDRIVDVNLKGSFYCSQAAAKRMVVQGQGGNIVNITSVGAYAAQQYASLYCATKAALASLAQGMALELAEHNIRVNCVAPGDINTPTSAESRRYKDSSNLFHKFDRVTPAGFQGLPRDIGHAVAYLVSDEAKFVTGTTLIVDGGWLTY